MKALRVSAGIAKTFGLAALEHLAGGYIVGEAQKIAESTKEKIDDQQNKLQVNNSIEPIKELRKQFEKCVELTCAQKNVDRIAIFVDDLDRLEPRRAVELLEVLKLFLDCKRCVFILAIDYDVVSRGVIAKYGSVEAGGLTEDKGKSFFDKIIQVPFKMPTASYNITNYVRECFKQIGMPCNDQDELKIYEGLINNSIGTNPRAMKRLFNAFQLLTIVVKDKMLESSTNRQLLFAVLCLQYCNEKIYDFVVRNGQDLTADVVNSLVESNYEQFVKYVEDDENIADDGGLTEDDFESARSFLEKFKAAVDIINPDGNIDDKEIENLREVIKFSSITSANDNSSGTKRKKAQVFSSLDELNYKWNVEGKTAHLQKLIDIAQNLAKNKAIGSELIIKQNRTDIDVQVRFSSKKFFKIAFTERANGIGVEIYGESSILRNTQENFKFNKFGKVEYIIISIAIGDEEGIQKYNELIQSYLDILE